MMGKYWVREKEKHPPLIILISTLLSLICITSFLHTLHVSIDLYTTSEDSKVLAYITTFNPDVCRGLRVIRTWHVGRLYIFKVVERISRLKRLRDCWIYVVERVNASVVSIIGSPYTLLNYRDVEYYKRVCLVRVPQYVHRFGWRLTGSGVTVCIIDSGVDYLHPELRDCVYVLVSLFYRKVNSSTYLTWIVGVNGSLEEAWMLDRYLYSEYGVFAWMDDNGHGTHVAGIIASRGLYGIRGLAPSVRLVVVRCFDREGLASFDDCITALCWIYNNSEQFKIKVVNISWGCTGDNRGVDPLSLLIDYITQEKRIFFVCAMGNLGTMPFTVCIPACARYAISVGAYNTWNDTIASFTSIGPTNDLRIKPDFLGAGVLIPSTKPVTVKSYLEEKLPQLVINDYYMLLSGTSMSAPCITAVVASILEQHPDITYNKLIELLREHCIKLTFTKDVVCGFGIPRVG